MIQKLVFAFTLAVCGLYSASQAHEYPAHQGQDGVYLPIQSDLIGPSQDEHHIGSIYVPTYHQETTFTFPEYETGTEVEEAEDKNASFLDTILGLLPIPKKVALIMTSGILWTYKNIMMLFVGIVATVALCTYGNLCTIAWQPSTTHLQSTGHDQFYNFRSLATPARLEAATSFIKQAIKKYKNLQRSKVRADKS